MGFQILQAFKSLTTNAYIRGVHDLQWTPFDRQLWLRNYWERVVRDDAEWSAMQHYIVNNPGRWAEDKHHPDHIVPAP